MKTKLLIILLFVITSCNPDEPTPIMKFTIYQGDHFCTPHPLQFINGSTMKFQVKFDYNCAYDLGNSNQDDLNKIAGFSDNNSAIHNHSARFTNRWIVERSVMEIHAYWYRGGLVASKKMGETTLGKWDNYEISAYDTTYYFNFNGNEFKTGRSAPIQGIKTKSWPYFGGDEVATHDMTIYIKEL